MLSVSISDIILMLYVQGHCPQTNFILGGANMAKCEVCGKGVHFGNAVSHSHRRSNRIWNSNVKSVKCKVNGAARKLHVCTSCLKSGKVERA